MYYNKDLFVNETIKANYNRLYKKQTILSLSVVLSAMAIALAVIITLAVKFPEMFMTGYAMAIFATATYALMFSLTFPIGKKLDLLRNQQAEELKAQPIYEKYTALLKKGRELNKMTDCITFSAVAIAIIAVWVLAAIFPYDFWCAYAFVFPILICNLILLTRRNKIKQIKTLEAEILREIHDENRNQNGKAEGVE